MQTFVILYNIRSAHNVGSIFRTADGAGASKVFLVGYTPAPIDRFGRVQPEIEKTSLGAAAMVPWEAYADIDEVLVELKKIGAQIVAVEQTPEAEEYRGFHPRGEHVAYLFGNETEGVPRQVTAVADAVIEIPMKGRKESLNVSVAVGVILFNTQ